ncbi:MAG: V-type ATP synthase subunit K [Bdellovibrionota bacterium]|jgi:V/A-type H+-transporting ATPase subunit K
METSVMLGQLGYALPLLLGAMGSALGVLYAGRAAMGEWAKEGKSGKVQRFTYLIFTGMPLSQTLYGFVFMYVSLRGHLAGSDMALATSHGGVLFGLGLGCGLIQFISALVQGILGAGGCRVVGDSNGKGLGSIISAMGIAESIGLLGLVFCMLLMPKI